MAVLRIATPCGGIDIELKIFGDDDLGDTEPLAEPGGSAPEAPDETAVTRRLGSIFSGLIKAVASSKPDAFAAFAVEWLCLTYADAIPPALEAAARSSSWSRRKDVAPTQQAFLNYLMDIQLAPLLEKATEAALLAKPENVPAFLLDLFQAELVERKAASLAEKRRSAPAALPAKGATSLLSLGLTLTCAVGAEGQVCLKFQVR